MKADLRISIKDYRRNKSLKVLLYRTPWPRQFFVRMNGERWPKEKGMAFLSRVFAVLRKGVVRGMAIEAPAGVGSCERIAQNNAQHEPQPGRSERSNSEKLKSWCAR